MAQFSNQLITQENVNDLYQFFDNKFKESVDKDAYFILSKIVIQLFQIKPKLISILPELQSRFCQDIYQSIQMQNYCISCLKFINPDDSQLQLSRNQCPACGMQFCCGYCSSSLQNHPCELITKFRHKSLFFNPEIQTMQLQTKQIINQYQQRKDQADTILNIPDGVKIEDLQNDMLLKESQEYYDIQVKPVYKTLFKGNQQSNSSFKKQLISNQIVDPFLFPYFQRICDLYSQGLVQIKQNQKYIEHCSIEVLQQTSLLSSKQMKLITGFNEFVFLIKQLEYIQNNKELTSQFSKANEIYHKLTSILNLNDQSKMIMLPEGVSSLIYELYSIVSQYIYSKLSNNVNILVDQYQKSTSKTKHVDQQITTLTYEHSQQFEMQKVLQDAIVQAQSKEAELKQKIKIFQAVPIEQVFHEQKHAYVQQILDNFSGLTSSHQEKIQTIEKIISINNTVEQVEISPVLTPNFKQQQQKQESFNLARIIQQRQQQSTSNQRLTAQNRSKSQSGNWKPRAQSLKQPLMLSQVLLGQQTNFQKPQMFTRKVVCVSDKSRPQPHFNDFIADLDHKMNQRPNSSSKDAKWANLRQQYNRKINVFDRAKQVQNEVQQLRIASEQLVQINIMRQKKQKNEQNFTIDTRILHPFFKEFVHKKAIQNYKFQSNLWYLLSLFLMAKEEILASQQYRQNCIQVIRDAKYYNFCMSKQLYLGFNKVCKFSAQQRLNLEPNQVSLGTEGTKRIDLVNKLVDRRVNIMPSKARKEMYQKLRGYVFDLKGLREFDGIVMGEPM